jgi:putrescine aminotransferase
VDSALKLARLATGRPDFISAHGAWHGFSLAALSVSERRLCRDFEPLLGGVTQVPYGDIEAVDAHIDDRTAAVIVEPIQAESGAVVPPDRYLRGLREVCDRRDVVLVLDEVKTGIGKTGRMFACQHDDVAPDILLSGKSLGGGFMPIGAMTAKRSLWTKFGLSFPMASSSGAGNLLACAAALATLEVVEAEGLCEQASRKGEFLKQALSEIACEFPSVIKGTSGRGLLLALHADGLKTANALVRECIRGGVLVMTAFCDRTKVLLEPPLCISDEQLHTVATTVRDAARKLAEAPRSPASTPA